MWKGYFTPPPPPMQMYAMISLTVGGAYLVVLLILSVVLLEEPQDGPRPQYLYKKYYNSLILLIRLDRKVCMLNVTNYYLNSKLEYFLFILHNLIFKYNY